MDDFKGTPGPWSVQHYNSKNPDIAYVANDNGKYGEVCMVGIRPRDVYNAQLIAAAPDLFEAVNILLNTPIDQFDSKKIEICIRARNKALGKETEE